MLPAAPDIPLWRDGSVAQTAAGRRDQTGQLPTMLPAVGHAPGEFLDEIVREPTDVRAAPKQLGETGRRCGEPKVGGRLRDVVFQLPGVETVGVLARLLALRRLVTDANGGDTTA